MNSIRTALLISFAFMTSFQSSSQVKSAKVPEQSHTSRQVVTVNFLYEACGVVGQTAKGKIPFFDCESYVYGVLDSYLAVRSSIPRNLRACFPATITPSKVLEDVRSLGIEDKQGSKVAGPVLIDAMRIKYPCAP